jgi:hypothetical protein
MSIPANDTQWAADCAVAEKEKISVCDVANRRENAALASEILPGTIAEIDRELEAAEAARMAALEKKTAVESIAGQWDVLLDRKIAIERELSQGQSRFNAIDIDGRVEFINANLGADDNATNSLQRLTELAAWVRGAKELRDVIYPEWKKAKQAELAKAVSEIQTFAKANKISCD